MLETAVLTADEKVQRDVLDELHWDTKVDAAGIGIEVHDGVVTLTGAVNTYAKRLAAENAALRVYGVRGIVNHLEVNAYPHARTDSEIAVAAARAIEWNPNVRQDRIQVRVEDGFVTLEGTVDHFFEKKAAEQTVEDLLGVRGVENLIEIHPEPHEMVSPATLWEELERALTRNAELDARRIGVSVRGSTVTLTGNVRSWAERRQAVATAWSTPGVATVVDHLQIVP